MTEPPKKRRASRANTLEIVEEFHPDPAAVARAVRRLLAIPLPGGLLPHDPPLEPAPPTGDARVAPAQPPPLDERAYSRALRRHKPVTGTPD